MFEAVLYNLYPVGHKMLLWVVKSIATFLITNRRTTGYIGISVVLCYQKGCEEYGNQETTDQRQYLQTNR